MFNRLAWPLLTIILLQVSAPTFSKTCAEETQSIFERGLKAEQESRLEDARALFTQATQMCDQASYWQALGDIWANDFIGDSADAVNADGGPALEAYGKAFSAARRDQDAKAGAKAARSLTELGLRGGDPIKANEWLLVARQLEPAHEGLPTLQEEVDFAREELSTGEIETGLSQTRGLGRVNSLLAGGASAKAYWDAPVSADPQTNSLAVDPLDNAAEGGGTSLASISIPINFESNSTSVTPATAANLENLAAVLVELPKDQSISLIGHADVRGDAYYNLRLSRDRAEAVRDTLVRIQPTLAGRIAAQGKGEEAPVDNGNSERAHANNRRLDVILSG